MRALPARAEIAELSGELRERDSNVLAPFQQAGGETALMLARQVGPNMAAEDQEEAARRFSIIEPLLQPDCFIQQWFEAGQKKTVLIENLAARHAVERSTIWRWLALWEQGGLAALVRRGRSDKGTSRTLNPAARDFILASALPKYRAYGELSAKEIHRAYQEEATWRASNAGQLLNPIEASKYGRYLDKEGRLRSDAQLPEASYHTFARWLNRIPSVLRVMARQGPEAFSATQDILSWRDLAATRAMEFIVMDHRTLDCFALIPIRGGWRIGRPWITCALDMASRRWLGWVMCEVPSSDSIASVLKKVIFQHGIPEAVLWDNGRDFRSHFLEGQRLRTSEPHRIGDLGDTMRGVLTTLGIRVHHSIVKRARAKLIEPAFVATANFDRTLPSWVGNRPQARPERLAEMVRQHERWVAGKAPGSPFPTIDHISGLYDELFESLNNREHSGLGMEKVMPTGRGWSTPNEVWSRLIGDVVKRTAPPEVLQMAFQRRKILKVRNGELCASFSGHQFHYRMTDEPLRLMGFNAESVELAYDQHDLGTGAVYHEGRFIGIVDSVGLRCMGRGSRDFVADERDRRVARREVKRFIQNVHQAIPIPGAEERAARRAAVRPALIEPAREEVAAQMPAALIEAAAAIEQRRSFKFNDVPPDQVEILTLGRGADTDTDPGEGEFNFFQGGNR